jgi:glucokinase
MSNPRVAAAIDLGGTKIRTLVVDETGRILGVDQRPTRAADGREPVIGRIIESVHEACAVAGVRIDEVAAIGVDVPGPVDFDAGILLEAPNLHDWTNVALGPILSERLGPPTFVENDANAAAYGEFRFGAGRGLRHMLYITVSTGIGGGIIIDGKLYRGADGTAGEMGHITVEPSAERHSCGMHGCLEMLASGTAIGNAARAAAQEGRSPMLTRALADGMLTAKECYDAAKAGDPVAAEILATAARYLGIGLANYINIFNPEMIVIGGGASNMFDLLVEPAWTAATSMAFARPAQSCRIARAELGGDSGAFGMAALALEGSHHAALPSAALT